MNREIRIYCKYCRKKIPEDRLRRRAIYCNNKCRKEHLRELRGDLSDVYMPPTTKGAIAELKTCADLLKKGYHVFKAVSPSCPCDLVIWDGDNTIELVEVKSVVRDKKGGVVKPGFSLEKGEKHTVLAMVIHAEDKIVYEPYLCNNSKLDNNKQGNDAK